MKKMTKKAVSLGLVATMALSMTACNSASDNGSTTTSSAATESTAANGTETSAQEATTTATEGYKLDKIKVVVNGTLTATEDNGQADFIKQWEDAVGIKMEIQQYDHSGYTDAVGRLFASGDYPDVMIMSADMFKQYATTGLLWDMSKAYDNAEFQSRITLPAINENLKDSEGHLYGFAPTYGNGCVTYVKKAWLDNVGLSADDIKTFDDYYNMLLKFHNEDPDGNGIDGDTYGVVAAGYMGNEAPWINYMPEFWQDAYPAIYQDETGAWVDGFNTDATKAAIERIAKGVAEGAVDPESLTASTKIAREKWFSNDQTGSSGVFTYWAGSWYQTLTDNLVKNNVDSELVMLKPIAEVGAYINREAPVWVIIDDGDGDDSREQAIFDAVFETMFDGGTVQTLWVYGAEGYHWSTEAETIVTGEGTDNAKTYEYKDGEFHLRLNPSDPSALWKKNAIDPSSMICSLENGFESATDLTKECNEFFSEHSVDAPHSASCDGITNYGGTINDAKNVVIAEVVVKGGDVDAAMDNYVKTTQDMVDEILGQLNAD